MNTLNYEDSPEIIEARNELIEIEERKRERKRQIKTSQRRQQRNREINIVQRRSSRQPKKKRDDLFLSQLSQISQQLFSDSINHMNNYNKRQRVHNVQNDNEDDDNEIEIEVIPSQQVVENNIIQINNEINNNPPIPIRRNPTDILNQNQIEINRQTRNNNNRNKYPLYYEIARNEMLNTSHISLHDVGNMDQVCLYCGAFYWKQEATKSKKIYTNCCLSGKINIPKISTPPDYLKQLFLGTHQDSNEFLNNIRIINCDSSFSSASCQLTHISPILKIQGMIYHNIGTIIPKTGTIPRNMQVYFYDNNSNIRNLDITSNTKKIISNIQTLIKNENPFFQSIKTQLAAIDVSKLNNYRLIFHSGKNPSNSHSRSYNEPTCAQVAGIILTDIEDTTTPVNPRVLSIHLNGDAAGNNNVLRIPSTSRFYDPIAYMCFFPKGDFGWEYKIPFSNLHYERIRNNRDESNQNQQPEQQINEELNDDQQQQQEQQQPEDIDYEGQLQNAEEYQQEDENVMEIIENDDDEGNTNENRNNPEIRDKYVTLKQFYNYILQIRDSEKENIQYDTIFYGRMLFHQYCIDQWIKTEEFRLLWVKTHQKKIKSELYQGLVDAIAGNSETEVGTSVILPSSHQGSPRYYQQCFYDAMAIVRALGKPDLFITFTCNPSWPEIKNNSKYRQQPWTRPDIVDRVFFMKLNELMHDIKEKKIFGPVVALIHVVEFQKRGLPHAHILVILDRNHKIRTVEDIDKVVSAEIPDPIIDKELHDIVKLHMLHGPCGALNPNCSCMIKGKCSKNFPKVYLETTECSDDSYPKYKRRSPEHHGKKVQVSGVELDNRWVVPYNKFLLKKYNAHINVEICNSIQSINYLYKYIYKGHDRIVFSVEAVETSPNISSSSTIITSTATTSTAPLTTSTTITTATTSATTTTTTTTTSTTITTATATTSATTTTTSTAPPTTSATTTTNDATSNPNTNNNFIRQQQIVDEVANYTSARYICAHEALWRLYGYPLNSISPRVERLPIHLPNQQVLIYEAGKEFEVINDQLKCESKLMAYFSMVEEERLKRHILNQQYYNCDSNGIMYPTAEQLTYPEFPQYYRWIPSQKKWKRRDKKKPKVDIISRIYAAWPTGTQKDKYYLRILLYNVCGCASFDELLRFENIQYNTFQEVCIARGLVTTDNEWIECIREASETQLPYSLRQLFVIILLFNNPSDPLSIWSTFKDKFSDDFRYKRYQQSNQPSEEIYHFNDDDYDNALYEINDGIYNSSGGLLGLQSFHLPIPTKSRNIPNNEYDDNNNTGLINNQNQIILQCQEESQSLYNQMNRDQIHAVQQIENSLTNNDGEHKNYFIDAPGGTGKTFIFQYLLSKFYSLNKNVLIVASSGIAATLLPGGRTAHSTFQIPIPLYHDSNCGVREGSAKGQLLKNVDVVLWDEAPMMGKYVYECVDRLMRRLTQQDNIPFGGKKFILAGDFRQILPVVTGYQRSGSNEQVIKNSNIWNQFHTLNLTINERIKKSAPDDQAQLQEFSNFLLEMGEGKLPINKRISLNSVAIPDKYLFKGNNLEQFIDSIIPPQLYNNHHQEENTTADQQFNNVSILCATNVHVERINDICLNKQSGELHVLTSADEIIQENDNGNFFPHEFLESLNPSGLPLHKLKLKIGSPVILLRNIDSKGLCNGTRLQITGFQTFSLLAKVLTGPKKNEIVLIPRVDLTSAESKLPFFFKRRQYPIKLAFAMTINKSQGQSMQKIGIYLPTPVFTHGQLYVAFSRAENPNNISVFIENVEHQQGKFPFDQNIYTNNVVDTSVLS